MKKYIILILTTALLSGCSLPSAEFDNSPNTKNKTKKSLFNNSQTIDTNNYLLYQPNKDEGKILVFIIPPIPEQVPAYINAWKKYAKDNNFLIVAPKLTGNEKVVATVKEIKQIYKPTKTFITGFSAGGYNSCALGLQYHGLADGIIPMGAFCRTMDLTNKKPPIIPILVVVGGKDTWARGDDLTYIDNANKDLKKYGLTQEQIIVPNIGHSFPAQAMPEVVNWILKN